MLKGVVMISSCVLLGIIILGFICRPIVRCINEHRKKITEYIILDSKIKQNIAESCHEIDVFYADKSSVEKLLKTNVLFRRKVQLLGRVSCEKDLKEVVVVVITGLISALLTKFLDLDEYATFIKNGVPENAALFLKWLTGIGVIVLIPTLFGTIHLNHENVKTQISRYELEYIDKVIEKHIKTNLQNVKKLEYKKAEDLFYCRRFNAYIVKPQR